MKSFSIFLLNAKNEPGKGLVNVVMICSETLRVLLHSMNFSWKFIFFNVAFCSLAFCAISFGWHLDTRSDVCMYFDAHHLPPPLWLILHNYSALSYLLFKWFPHLAGWLKIVGLFVHCTKNCWILRASELAFANGRWLNTDKCNQHDCGKRIFFAFTSFSVLFPAHFAKYLKVVKSVPYFIYDCIFLVLWSHCSCTTVIIFKGTQKLWIVSICCK